MDLSAPDTVALIPGESIEPRAINWLWNYYLARGKLSLIAGAPGTGKTTIALAIAAALSNGARWPDGTRASPASTLIWTGEDDPADTLVPRLLAMGADMTRIKFVGDTISQGDCYPFDPARDLPLLTLKASGFGNIGLLILDPIVSAVSGDSHKNAEVRRGLQPVIDFASSLDCAVIGISHYSKGTQGRDPVERVTGSVAYGALARVVLGTAKGKPGEKRRLVRAKSNCGPDGGGFEYELLQVPVPGHDLSASVVAWAGALEGEARDLLADAESDADDSTSPSEVVNWLKTLLTEESEGLEKSEVMKAAKANGHSESAVQRARKRLGLDVHLTGFGKAKRSVWSLPSIRVTYPSL